MALMLQDVTNSDQVADYLTTALADSQPAFLLALGEVVRMRGFTIIAQEAGIRRESLYTICSKDGNPTICSLVGILSALGLRFSVERIIPQKG